MYNYAKFQVYQFTFDNQNICLRRPCFGEIRYDERDENISACVQGSGSFCDKSSLTLLGDDLDIHNWSD